MRILGLSGDEVNSTLEARVLKMFPWVGAGSLPKGPDDCQLDDPHLPSG
jgi:hypothetical protein